LAIVSEPREIAAAKNARTGVETLGIALRPGGGDGEFLTELRCRRFYVERRGGSLKMGSTARAGAKGPA